MKTSEYVVDCYHCSMHFDARVSMWCSCASDNRSLICPECGLCFCKSAPAYSRRFWDAAPDELWIERAHLFRWPEADWRNPPAESIAKPLSLLVTANADVAITVRAMKEISRYDVLIARDGREALALARNYAPQLVITEAVMPRLDGRELCCELRRLPVPPNRIIVMSGSASDLNGFAADAVVANPPSASVLLFLLTLSASFDCQTDTAT